MAQAESWQSKLTKVVAGEIRRWRLQRGMSAQQLADRCAQLGHAIPRPVLSNIETGRRESITLAELVILAAALNISPTLLVAPVRDVDVMEVLPGKELPTYRAFQWWLGALRPEELDSGLVAENPMVAMFLRQMEQQSASRGLAGVPQDAGESLRLVREMMIYLNRELSGARREQGYEPPPLPPELNFLEESESP